MKIFEQLIKTSIEIVKLPVAITKDICTLGGVLTDDSGTYTGKQLEKIKEASEE